MSRSGYVDSCYMEPGDYGRWRGVVASAVRGKRGQKLLREMLEAFDAMPVKELIARSLIETNGQRCALGVLAEKRGIDVADLDPDDCGGVAEAFDVAPSLAQEIVYENDEVSQITWDGDTRQDETPTERWTRMRAWVAANIVEPATIQRKG